MAIEKQWYVQYGGTELGPLSSAQFKELAATARISPATLVRLGLDGTWVPAGNVKGLFAAETPSEDRSAPQPQRIEQEFRALQRQHQALQEQYAKDKANWQTQSSRLEEWLRHFQNNEQEAKRTRDDLLQLRCDQQVVRLQYEQDQAALVQLQQYTKQLTDEYHRAKPVYDQLRHEIGLLEENLEDISFGLYKPHFEFDTSEAFRRELESVRDAKKRMVRNDTATRCLVEWHVGGSRAEGIRMQKQLSKLMLRAFNGETDAAIATCRWNNVTRMEERIRRSHLAINKLGAVIKVEIVPQYLELALQELQLEFEYEEKKRAEAEEQREIRERMREEEKAQRELERAEAETAAEEQRYARALKKAQDEVARAHGLATAEQTSRIAELERQLADAHARHERAVSMAELTRCGYVYIISNIGSFGEDMYKIGLTRRLEPLDRVRELGDASVPFTFDVHAMVYSEDAPALERLLHQHFRGRRVNLVNPRKEFFYISLEDLEDFVKDRGLELKLTKLAEAREYRESLSMRAKEQEAREASVAGPVPKADAFPQDLFAVAAN